MLVFLLGLCFKYPAGDKSRTKQKKPTKKNTNCKKHIYLQAKEINTLIF